MAPFRDNEHYRSALRIVLLYAVFAGLWIYLSDTMLAAIVANPALFVRYSVLKGFLFIAVTGTFLVITDVVMPKMSGRELVESLRAMKGDLKFMYTSGYTNDTIVQHDILRSGTVLVEKPIDSEILLGRIREVLDSGKK